MCEEHNTLKLLSGFHGDLFVLRYQSLGLTEPLHIISKSSAVISQLSKMSITGIFNGAKTHTTSDCGTTASCGTVKSKGQYRRHFSPSQAVNSSKYLYFGGTMSQDMLFFFTSSQTQI